MPTYEIEMTVTRDEQDLDLTVRGNITRGSAGRVSGPPELCSPPEPDEVEIEFTLYKGKDWDGKLTRQEQDKAEELLLEAYSDNPPEPDFSDYEPYDG